MEQHCGEDKWEAIKKAAEDCLHNDKWNGQSNYSLEKHCAKHRNAYVQLQNCAEHIHVEVPSGHSRVGYLLESIKCPDPALQAAKASVANDKADDGARSNFEKAVAVLVPQDPVARKRNKNTKSSVQFDISGVETENGTEKGADVSAFGSKISKGKTGVEFRFHTKKEYGDLSHEQKEELALWRKSKGGKGDHGKGGGGGGSGKEAKRKQAAAISAAVKKELKKVKKAC